MSKDKLFSFEFFPPKTEAGEQKLQLVWQQLQEKQPDFFSVTYGAGGSTRDKTISTVTSLHQQGAAVAPHLSFGGDSRDTVASLLHNYKELGIKRVVALRGDLPSGTGGAAHLVYANELVEFIREQTGDHFHIEVAAYPEIHPQSKSYESDINYLKGKFDAGANSGITQYFYNADAYFYYIERCQAAGIDNPIVPGIMPITNYSSLARFSDACGAEIPRWMRKRLEGFADDSRSIAAYGVEVVTELCETLLQGGAPGLHFYSMNKAEPNITIWDNLGLGERR